MFVLHVYRNAVAWCWMQKVMFDVGRLVATVVLVVPQETLDVCVCVLCLCVRVPVSVSAWVSACPAVKRPTFGCSETLNAETRLKRRNPSATPRIKNVRRSCVGMEGGGVTNTSSDFLLCAAHRSAKRNSTSQFEPQYRKKSIDTIAGRFHLCCHAVGFLKTGHDQSDSFFCAIRVESHARRTSNHETFCKHRILVIDLKTSVNWMYGCSGDYGYQMRLPVL